MSKYHYFHIYLGLWLEELFFIRNNNLNQPALYYKNKHTEELSQIFSGWNIALLRYTNSMLLKINWLIAEQQTWPFMAAVKAI